MSCFPLPASETLSIPCRIDPAKNATCRLGIRTGMPGSARRFPPPPPTTKNPPYRGHETAVITVPPPLWAKFGLTPPNRRVIGKVERAERLRSGSAQCSGAP
jgi:hypothetical protein